MKLSFNVKKMTKKEMEEKLQELGIEYAEDALKAELERILFAKQEELKMKEAMEHSKKLKDAKIKKLVEENKKKAPEDQEPIFMEDEIKKYDPDMEYIAKGAIKSAGHIYYKGDVISFNSVEMDILIEAGVIEQSGNRVIKKAGRPKKED